MPAYRFDAPDGGFTMELPGDGWTAGVLEDSEIDYAVAVNSPDGEARLLIRRFRFVRPVRTADEFETVLVGVLAGLEEVLRPMRVLEQKVEPEGDGMRADLVVRGRQEGRDVMQRRRLLTPGPVPPAPLMLLTGSCPADRFLVHRRTFERILDSFRWVPPREDTPTGGEETETT